MSYHINNCRQCGEHGTFDMYLQFTHRQKTCDKCHHSESGTWQYWFCNRACMFQWLKDNEIEDKGFPCQGCLDFETGKPCGFAYGFESNGVCKVCEGTLRVQERKVE